MKPPKFNLLILLACAALCMPHIRAGAQAGATLDEQIRAAVDAEGDEYFKLREKILAQGETARTALQAVTQWDRPEARVIAQALLKWLDEENGQNFRMGKDLIYTSPPEMPRGQYNKEYAERIASGHCYNRTGERVRHALSQAGGWEDALCSGFYRYAIRGDEDVRKYWPHDVYLLELALKGYAPEFLNVMGKPMSARTREFHRMCAAAAAGVSPCTNTVAVLTLLLDVKHPPRVRQGALAGLAAVWVRASRAAGGGLPEDPRCLPTLDKALDDPAREVRLEAYHIVTLLTEDKLGIDLDKRTSYALGLEDVKIIRDNLAKWQAEQKKKAVGDAALVEQGAKSAATPAPPPEPAPSP